MKFIPNTDINKIISKAALSKKTTDGELKEFKDNIRSFFKFVKDGQEERTQAGFLNTFLEKTYYKEKYLLTFEEDKKDISIHSEYTPDSDTYVFIETKKTNSNDMVSQDSLESLAFYETILYYMNERSGGKNELKHIVITNMYEWCIIDALEYDRLFWRDRYFKGQYTKFINKQLAFQDRKQFYDNEIAPFVKKSQSSIRYAYFNLKERSLTKDNKVRDNVNAIYKILSPSFLFKQYERDDNNQLRRDFYLELLHIMGLEEVEGDGGRLIKRNKQQYEGSLIENAIEQIKTNPVLKLNIEGDSEEERIYNTALQLSITWINRLLFLKLLEAQLCSYHNDDEEYKFLTSEKLKNYNDVDTLFFRVLALTEDNRSQSIKNKYPHVPYLNSSLFEVTKIESFATRIARLDINANLPLYENSVLKKYVRSNKKSLNPLEYLLLFLDSYDYGATKENNNIGGQRSLISASVLGLIFEKINGYKDGSIFTPSKITMLMCRQTLRKAVLDKFRTIKHWDCDNFTKLHNYITLSEIEEANNIINSIKICDPAVGSGHFLVSALNEIISIKSDLDIIRDKDGRLLRDYTIQVQNDELIIVDSDGIPFKYEKASTYTGCQRVQEIIFNEKRTIIENCLFGVDINMNSVNICQLRLWIELLKSTYYDRESGKLQTLPNIDINIKNGNSLVSKFPIRLGKTINIDSQLAKKLKANLQNYKKLVFDYKQSSDKSKRPAILESIHKIRQQFLGSGELNLWGDDDLIDYKDPYHDSTEWMLIFPEVLDDEARFTGFDVIIGNPPYINLQKMKVMSKFYRNLPGKSFTKKTYQTYHPSGDIYTLFFELGRMLVREEGTVSYIVSNSWMKTQFGEKTRDFLSKHTNPILLIDFTGFKVFENVTVETCILTFERSTNLHNTLAANVNKEDYQDLNSYIADSLIPCTFDTKDFWYILQPQDQKIRNQIVKRGTQLSDKAWNLKPNFGIKTGCNEAFIIDEKKYQEILNNCSSIKERELTKRLIQKVIRGEDILRYGYNWNDLYLIATFPSRNHEISIYPSVIKHLESFAQNWLRERGYGWISDDENLLREFCRKKLYQTGKEIKIEGKTLPLGKRNAPLKARKKSSHKWFELQDNIAFWKDFSKSKLIWKRIGSDVRFAYDETGILTLDSTCIVVGNKIKYLCGVLNSKMGRYLLKYSPRTGTGDSLVSVQAFHPIYVPIPSAEQEQKLSNLVDKMSSQPTEAIEQEIDDYVFKLYGITEENSIRYINSVI